MCLTKTKFMYVFVVATLFLILGHAEFVFAAGKVVIRASSAEQRSFEIYAKIHSSQTWSEYWFDNYQSFSDAEIWQKTIYFVLEDAKPARAYEEVRQNLLDSAEWNDAKRAMLMQLLEKLLQNAENSQIRADFCLLQAVIGARTEQSLCKVVPRSSVRQYEKILAFGRWLPKGVVASRNYRFVKVDDVGWPHSDWASLAVAKLWSLTPVVSGKCRSWQEAESKVLPSGSDVFFDQDCISVLRPDLTNASESRKFWENNKRWILPSALVLAVGALALKDKTISFSF